jgi:hypothetical protein
MRKFLINVNGKSYEVMALSFRMYARNWPLATESIFISAIVRTQKYPLVKWESNLSTSVLGMDIP